MSLDVKYIPVQDNSEIQDELSCLDSIRVTLLHGQIEAILELKGLCTTVIDTDGA